MGRKTQRKSLVFRLGLTPRSRWKKSSNYYFDAYSFGGGPSTDSDESGYGIRILWLILAVSFVSEDLS